MKRKPTNSVTELVKTIAREVFNEVIDKAKADIMEEVWNEFCVFNSKRKRLTPYVYDRGGQSWTFVEDALLRNEIGEAIQEIATTHERTAGAIVSRIKQKELIQKDYERR